MWLRQNEEWEVLELLWGVNASPLPSQGDIDGSLAYVHRAFTLPNGTKGVDARATMIVEGAKKEWRRSAVRTEFANYHKVSAENAKYFDAIIDSVCYQPRG